MKPLTFGLNEPSDMVLVLHGQVCFVVRQQDLGSLVKIFNEQIMTKH